MKRIELCESAKRGNVCIDDLCRADITLCGFDRDLYEEITDMGDYDEPGSDYFDDSVKFCPNCERPNQFGEFCEPCRRELAEELY